MIGAPTKSKKEAEAAHLKAQADAILDRDAALVRSYSLALRPGCGFSATSRTERLGADKGDLVKAQQPRRVSGCPRRHAPAASHASADLRHLGALGKGARGGPRGPHGSRSAADPFRLRGPSRVRPD
jgi:hypothetical protein